MKAQELYDMEAQDVSRDPSRLVGCYYNHIDECAVREFDCEEADRLEIRTIKHHDFDGRRYWSLATVWFDSKPIMVVQNAGREGDDHAARFITDAGGFREMCRYIASLHAIEEIDDVITIDEDRDDLDAFYGNNLSGYFERYG